MGAADFYTIKGLMYLVMTVLIIVHMARSWDDFSGWGQRLRYFFLLYLVVIIASASVEQIAEEAVINKRNVAAFIGGVLGLITMTVTWAEWRRHRRP